jgi:hypothetical protein
VNKAHARMRKCLSLSRGDHVPEVERRALRPLMLMMMLTLTSSLTLGAAGAMCAGWEEKMLASLQEGAPAPLWRRRMRKPYREAEVVKMRPTSLRPTWRRRRMPQSPRLVGTMLPARRVPWRDGFDKRT